MLIEAKEDNQINVLYNKNDTLKVQNQQVVIITYFEFLTWKFHALASKNFYHSCEYCAII